MLVDLPSSMLNGLAESAGTDVLVGKVVELLVLVLVDHLLFIRWQSSVIQPCLHEWRLTVVRSR